MNPKHYTWFVKAFFVYIFLEYLLLQLWDSMIVKFAGDILIIAFILFTFRKGLSLKRKDISLLAIAGVFILVSALSLIMNRLEPIHLLLGIRSVLRYMIVFFLASYHNLTNDDARSIYSFLVASIYFESVIFFFTYFLTGIPEVLGQTYLMVGVYLNVILAAVLHTCRGNKRMILLLLILVQGLMTGSRLAVAGIILQLAVFTIMIWKASAVKKAGTMVGAMLITAALAILFNSMLEHTEIWRKFSDTSIEVSPDQNFRLYLASHFTAHSIENSNLIGDGPDTFGTLYSRHYNRDYYQRYGLSDREIAYAADSDYANLLMQYGFLGLAVLALLFGSLFSQVRPEGRPLMILMFSFMLLGMFALPVFTMRMPSFSLFTFLALERRRE